MGSVEALQIVFAEHDIELNVDTAVHFGVMMDALKVYAERSQAYGQAWTQYGAMSNLLSMARKVDRLMAVWWSEEDEGIPKLHKDNLDDAIDEINYTIFFIRCARSANLFGSAPSRPPAD